MNAVRGRVSETGGLSIPAEVRRAVGLDRGGEVIIEVDGADIRIRSVTKSVSRAQELARRAIGHLPDAGVEAFLAERRREAEME